MAVLFCENVAFATYFRQLSDGVKSSTVVAELTAAGRRVYADSVVPVVDVRRRCDRHVTVSDIVVRHQQRFTGPVLAGLHSAGQ